jgi:60 kDa SS-A/Ro ribonucleoprotein
LKEDGIRVVKRIVDVSVRGLAPKQDHAIFALAVAASEGNLETRQLALASVNDVCRTASTFFAFLEELKPLRKLTGRAIRRVISDWYNSRDVDRVAFEAVKYGNRSGWSHADALRVGHPSPQGDESRNALYNWIVKKEWNKDVSKPLILEGFLQASSATSAKEVAKYIEEYKLPREAIPTQFLNSPEVWEALLPHMPLTALIRNLGNMTKSGLLQPGNESTQLVLKNLQDEKYIKKSRVHPMNILVAMKTYQSGQGFKGSGSWTPVSAITSELDDAFYKAFANVTPTGKRFLIGVDVSYSMSSGAGLPGGLTPCEVAAAMSMIFVATEKTVEVMGFCDQFVDLAFTRKMSLSDAMAKAQRSNFRSTDASLPMLWASKKKLNFDVFGVITDNDTNTGAMHPKQALAEYRRSFVSDARQFVLATTATNFSIADPSDPLALDIAGFSSDVPQVIATFINGSSNNPVVEED